MTDWLYEKVRHYGRCPFCGVRTRFRFTLFDPTIGATHRIALDQRCRATASIEFLAAVVREPEKWEHLRG